MNRRGFLAGLCGAVAAVLGWPRKVEALPEPELEVWGSGVNFKVMTLPEPVERMEVRNDELYLFGGGHVWVVRDSDSDPVMIQ